MNQFDAEDKYFETNSQGLTKTALITALYVALTFIIAPVGFGPIQFRISESLNFLGLFRKRYVTSITLGVMIVNAMLSTPIDIIVGTFHTLVSLLISRWIAYKLAPKFKNERIGQFVIMTLVFTFTMFIIAWMLTYIGAVPFFWETYLTLALSEFIAMSIGSLVIYPLSLRIDFTK